MGVLKKVIETGKVVVPLAEPVIGGLYLLFSPLQPRLK